MTRKLEETFNLIEADLPELDALDIEEQDESEEFSLERMHALIDQADKIDAALPQVSGLENADADYDEYARKAIATFDDLVDLGKNVEDRHAADIFNAASSMMANALNAKTNKAQKKLEMIKLQIHKAKLEHEKDKLDYLKKRHLDEPDDARVETEGHIISSRNDVINDILANLKKNA